MSGADQGRQSRVRTFKPRRRRLSPSRQARFDELAPRWLIGLDPVGTAVDPRTFFDADALVVLDIGIGIGESCIEMASADPSTNVIGVDVHTPGIATSLAAIDDRELTNLRLYHGDVFDLIAQLKPGLLSGIRVYFPDPWPKARHQRRRLISDERLPLFLDALSSSGWIHVATDVDDYAQQVEEVCGGHPALRGGRVERPHWRPVTRFETRGIESGRSITDLIYTVVSAAPC